MKKFKLIVGVIMAVLMIANLMMPVMAAGTTYTLTINKESAEHTYEAYQIFTGALSKDDNDDLVLSTIVWGTGVTAAGQTALGNAQQKANNIKTTADAEAFADVVAPYLSGVCATAVYDSAAKLHKIENLAPGYYLIKDKDDSLKEEEGYTAFIMKVVGDVSVTPKDGETVVTKKVDDVNDSNTSEDAIEWHDSADHDIGDAIDFQLKAVITENYDEYDNYYLALHDTEEKGLTFDPASVKVYIDGQLINAGYELVQTTTDGCTFEVVFENLKTTAAKAGSEIIVLYKSILNDDAVIGNQGNVNKVYGEFSNNPNEDSHGKTKEDTVIIFTYTVEVNKQDENNQPLPGAIFTLEKFEANTAGTATYNGVQGDWAALSTVETTPDTTFTFEGLDDGSYRLTETKAPEHYNAIEPIYFDVTAEHEIEWTMLREDVLVSLTGNVTTGAISFSADKGTGKLTTNVVNERGVILPETGGIGTTVFYIVGGLLVVAVLVFFIAKKRVSSK